MDGMCEILQEREGWGTLKALSPLGRLLPAATLRERQRALAVGCRRGFGVWLLQPQSHFLLCQHDTIELSIREM